MQHVQWVKPPESISLKRPVVVMGFLGWNDAGDAASTAVATLIETSSATLIAEIDPEAFTDFATVRPVVRLNDDGTRRIDWPTIQVFAAHMPGTDAVFILGPEPALRWREFSDTVVELCGHLGTDLVLSLGALLAEVSHTRPTQVIGTSTDDAVIERFDLGRSRYEGPTGIVGVLVSALQRHGTPTASLWSAVPTYAADSPSPAAASALIERACEMMGTPTPTIDFADQTEAFDQHIADLMAADEDLKLYITRLESIDDDDDGGLAPSREIAETDAATIAAEVEQFLRERESD